MNRLNIVRHSIMMMIIMLLSGCFSIEIDVPQEMTQNTLFTMSATPDGNEGEVVYEWRINDEVVSTTAEYHSMQTELGSYTISVKAVDEAGNEDTKTATLSIIEQASLNDNFSINVLVSDESGMAVEGAEVSVNNVIETSDVEGTATYTGINQTELMIVKASKEGFLTQSYQYTFSAPQESATVNIVLQALNTTVHTVDSSSVIELIEPELNTKLVLPENSFVDENGNAVAGDVDIRITPIDVRSVGSAFLGGAQGLSEVGESVILISAGMADFQFSQDGNDLQLAQGVVASIEMDLAQTEGDDGRVYAEGDQIPMWWFDDTTGFWVEDGVGTIQLSETAASGLKLVAQVTHFTTWNWDYKADDLSTINFSCLKEGAPLSLSDSCLVQFISSTINKQYVIGSSGGTIIRAPSAVTFNVRAKSEGVNGDYAGGLRFRTQQGENNIVINLDASEEKTGSIQCKNATDTGIEVIPCDIQISGGADVSLSTGGAVNYKADFQYLSGSPLDVLASAEGGLSKTLFVDTSFVNGDLSVEVLFSNDSVTLTCSASLNGGREEYIYCPALIEDDLGGQTALTNDSFSGDPLTATLNIDSDVQLLDFYLASEFDQAKIGYNKYRDFYYVGGEATFFQVDLVLDSKQVEYHYDVSSSDLYEFECRNPAGSSVQCDIVWYGPMEAILYEGPLSGLSDSSRKPSWISGKLYIENVEEGFGNARMEGGEYYYSDFTIVNNKIIFDVQ